MIPAEMSTITSGLILIPGVSSSKNLSKPALAAGIGDSRLRRFSRLLKISQTSHAYLLLLRFHENLSYPKVIVGRAV